jgi:hypothetical protein
MAVLEALKEETDIIVFPEYSIPFDYLKDIQQFADENSIIVVAGSHYVVYENLEKYEKLFARGFEEADLRKNISPVVIPSSKIVHNEKHVGAKIERPFLFEDGMETGNVNHILKLREKLNIGVMICDEFLNTEMRYRLVPVCNVILVPQTNPNTERFYQVELEDFNNPQYPGNKAYIMANGIFSFEGKTSGGSSGILLTLDKHSHKRLVEEAIKKPIDEVYEQFVLLASINTEYNPARDVAQGQVAISSRWIPIIEEQEILERAKALTEKKVSSIRELFEEDLEKQKELIEEESRKINVETQKFIELLQKIRTCEEESLKQLLESDISIIKKYSPLMYEEIAKDLANLTQEEIKEKCCPVFIPIDS